MYSALGFYSGAINDYTKLIELDPYNRSYYLGRAHIYAKQNKNYTSAIYDYTHAIDLEPGDSTGFVHRARAYFWMGDLTNSIQDWNQAIKIDPNIAKYYGARARMKLLKVEYQGAIDDCKEAINLSPKYSYPYKLLGDAFFKLRDYDKAISNYSASIELGPPSYDKYLLRGNARFHNRDIKLALKDFSQAGKLEPDYNKKERGFYLSLFNVWEHYELGLVESRSNNRRKAVKEFSDAMKLEPGLSLWLEIIKEDARAKKFFIEARKKHIVNKITKTDDILKAIFSDYDNKVKDETDEKKPAVSFKSPPDICRELDKVVIGQYEAKQRLSVACYNHINMTETQGGKSNILIIGPTGCGKTLLCKTIGKLLDVPFVSYDMTSLARVGIVGGHVTDVFRLLYNAAGNDLEKAEKGIIYFDEIDKLADDERKDIQRELLRVLEPNIVHPVEKSSSSREFPPINTKNILFILSGAFVGLEELRKQKNIPGFALNKESKDAKLPYSECLAKFGLMPELIGRLDPPIVMSALTKDELIMIMNNPITGLISEFRDKYKREGINLVFDRAVCETIAERALQRNTGARGLRAIIAEALYPSMYNVFGNPDAPREVNINDEYMSGLKQSAD